MSRAPSRLLMYKPGVVTSQWFVFPRSSEISSEIIKTQVIFIFLISYFICVVFIVFSMKLQTMIKQHFLIINDVFQNLDIFIFLNVFPII